MLLGLHLLQSLPLLMAVRPRRWWQVGAEDYDKLQVGFIAQEVKAVNDEMHAENNIVSIDEDGFHRMDYEKIIVPLVKAVQEQQAQITELQNKINAIMEMQASASASKSYGEGDQ